MALLELLPSSKVFVAPCHGLSAVCVQVHKDYVLMHCTPLDSEARARALASRVRGARVLDLTNWRVLRSEN